MIIHIDNREQKPYPFTCMRERAVLPFEIVSKCIPTGDYELGPVNGRELELRNQIVIERKSLNDLYGTLSQGRLRFEREFLRMKAYGYAALVIEASWDYIAQPDLALTHKTRLLPKSVVATLMAWSQRCGVHIWACPDRKYAERFTFRLLERWARDLPEKLAEQGRMEGAA